VSQAGLTETGRSVKKEMVKRLTPAFGGGNTYLQIFLSLILSDKVGQVPGSKTRIERCIFFVWFARDNACYFALPPLSSCPKTLIISFSPLAGEIE
jgi:hypothetical protein